jgi:multidrug efflux pump subunit AcrA (membrane-fusion protein)
MIFRSSLQAVLIAVLALPIVSCGSHEAIRAAGSVQTEPQSVPVVKATLDNLSGSITLTGEFIPYQEVEVMAKVTGYIREIGVDVGDRVKVGQVLATLEIPEMDDDLTRATAAIDQADAETARAQDDIRRAESAQQMTHLSSTRIGDVARREPGLSG